MPRKQKLCIYCGGTGMSKEHMWPDWLRPYVPRNMSSFHSQEVTLFRDGSRKVRTRRKIGDPHVTKLRVVCKSCNNGWMSRLQQDTKPLLVPMLTGESVTLYRRDQTLLARWIAMTVMTAEYFIGRHVCEFAFALAHQECWSELAVLPDPPSEGFYAKVGFADMGERRRSRVPGGPHFSLYRMQFAAHG